MKRTLKGKVTSAKMEKTIVVAVDIRKEHPLYRKKYTSTKKYMVHNEIEAKEGDYVVIEEMRPMSKNKKWNAKKIISDKKLEVE
jgi:small subunit ribosomal protein S17